MNYQTPIGSPLEPIPNNRPVRALYSRSGFGALGFLIAAQVSSIIVMVVYLLLYGMDYNSHHFLAVASAAQYLTALPTCWLIMRGAKKQARQKKHLPVKYLLGAFAIAILCAQIGSMIGYSCSSALSNLFHIDILDPLGETLDTLSTLEAILITGIFAPVFEELIFRKFVLDRATAYGDGAAVFLSALLFGLVHCNIFQFFYAFLLGLLFGYIYVKTGRLFYTIVLHCVFNLIGGVLVQFIGSHIENFQPSLVAVNAYQAAYLIYLIFYWAMLILGIVLTCIWWKKIKADLCAYTRNLGERFACVMSCGGVITTVVISLLLCLINIFSLAAQA